jgi:short-subunit dehydrogenase
MGHIPDGGVVVVTGASSGIGRACALQLASRARALVLVARREERLAALKGELAAAYPSLAVDVRPCDLADPDAAAQMIAAVEAELGAVDVLINNAGAGVAVPYQKSEWEPVAQMLRLNVIALALLTQRVLPGMVARRRGAILNVSSSAGLVILPEFAAYVGSKAFVSAFSESLRLDLIGTGVSVTHVCPGPVATEFHEIAGSRRLRPPRVTMLSAEACARSALRGLDRGVPMVVPGLLMKLGVLLAGLSPRWLLRGVFGLLARLARS